MCGRYGFTIKDSREVYKRFDIEKSELELKDNYNVAPTQEMPVVERHSPNSLHLRKWGIQPPWSKMLLINAQASKVNESKVWSKAFRESRCIVPANYFFEWKRQGDMKQPFLIRLKNREMFGFAGLTITYHDKDKKEQIGYVIITTEPNSLMEKIHNRMPVILRKEDEDEWLNPDNVEPEKLLKLLQPYHTTEMEAYPVSSLVNKPANNFLEITKQVKL
jgi:putative SOS response-associated peptidase YedK